MTEKSHIIDKDLHVKDAYLVFTEFFIPSNDTSLTKGTHLNFKTRMMLILGALTITRFTFLSRLPNVTEILASIAVGYLAVEAVVYIAYKFALVANDKSISGIFGFLGILFATLFALGMFI